MKRFFEITCSGIMGVILTLIVQYFFVKPQLFTFIYNGNEVVVTESTYVELVEKNKNLQEELTSSQTELAELQGQLKERDSEDNIKNTIQKVTTYWDNSEYIQALTLLKNCGINSENILVLYQKYSDEYCVNLLGQVDNLILERRYDDAKKLITQSKGLVFNSTVLDNKFTEIDNNLPIKLVNLKMSASRHFDINQDKPVEDSVGNKYSTGNLFITRAEGDTGYGYATFYLGQKYTGLSGTVAVSDESENRSDIQLEGWIEIYSKDGDDYTQLYSSPILSRTTSPINISEINLGNAEWLEIRYYNNGKYYNLARGYHSLEVILSDFMVYSS